MGTESTSASNQQNFMTRGVLAREESGAPAG